MDIDRFEKRMCVFKFLRETNKIIFEDFKSWILIFEKWENILLNFLEKMHDITIYVIIENYKMYKC